MLCQLSYSRVAPNVIAARRFDQSQRSGLNRRPLDYESSALPLSYCGERCQRARSALARTRTATPFGTTPSRWRVYQFHHQGSVGRAAVRPRVHQANYKNYGADGARTRDLSSDSRVL